MCSLNYKKKGLRRVSTLTMHAGKSANMLSMFLYKLNELIELISHKTSN